jgi:ParB family transcriptional regulator, chromosome partitioning protein
MSNNKQRGLGRDLESLLGKRNVNPMASGEAASIAAPSTTEPHNELRKLPVDVLQSGRYQPRQNMEPEALEELANSIRAQGVIQPIIVRSIGDKKYEIIAGERRWRAAQLAGLDTVPALVRNINDETASAMALIENVQREDLNPMEEAIAYHRLTDEFGLTHQEVANLVGKSRVAISNLLRLLNLNTDVKQLLENGDIEMGHARALLALLGPTQSEAARTVVNKSLTVRETESLIRRLQSTNSISKPVKTLDADTRRLQENLSEKLGAKVAIEHNPKGHGKLVINYSSLEELDGILAHIK